MNQRSLKNHERSLKWEKKEVEKRVNDILLRKAEPITKALIQAAEDGSFQAQSYALDRLFGKAKQAIDIESGGEPIIFMPTSLVAKFSLDKPVENTELPEYGEEKED